MKFAYLFILVCGFLVLGIVWMDAYLQKAWGDYLDLSGLVWEQEPVFCIIKPANMTEFEANGYSKYQLMKYVNLWKFELNKHTDSKVWDYTTVVLNKDTTYEWCNVRIYFADSGKKGGALGVTECYSLKKKPESMFCDITLFTKSMKANLIGSTVTHEVGHALGLGHRLAYTPCDFAAVVMSFDIMAAQASRNQKIIIDDLEALVEIYGDDGFGGENNYDLKIHEINPKPLKCA